jgi:hypothetical protein
VIVDWDLLISVECFATCSAHLTLPNNQRIMTLAGVSNAITAPHTYIQDTITNKQRSTSPGGRRNRPVVVDWGHQMRLCPIIS